MPTISYTLIVIDPIGAVDMTGCQKGDPIAIFNLFDTEYKFYKVFTQYSHFIFTLNDAIYGRDLQEASAAEVIKAIEENNDNMYTVVNAIYEFLKSINEQKPGMYVIFQIK